MEHIHGELDGQDGVDVVALTLQTLLIEPVTTLYRNESLIYEDTYRFHHRVQGQPGHIGHRSIAGMAPMGAPVLTIEQVSIDHECRGRKTQQEYLVGQREKLPRLMCLTHDAFALQLGEALLHAVELDYSDYRREVRRLREEHPLFEERMDIPVADLEDFVAETLMLPSLLKEKDPVGFFVLGVFLDKSLRMEDDGSASFLLRAGQQILRVLEEPIRVQTYLRNVFEATFDGMDGITHQEQFERLRSIYPDVAQICDPALLADVPAGGRQFSAHDLFALYLLELALYFNQDRQRIARCEYCWGYFIPKTKKITRYCDRVTDGFPCKQRGARFQRSEDREKDKALLVYKQLRDRMYARFLRYLDAAPEEMIILDLGKPDPQWKMLTADELRRHTQKGHQSLQEKYGKV